MDRMSSRTWALWQAYFAEEPWGEERADLRMARICSTIANVAPFRKSRKHVSEEVFLPKFGKAQAPSRAGRLSKSSDIRERLLAYTQAVGGTVVQAEGK